MCRLRISKEGLPFISYLEYKLSRNRYNRKIMKYSLWIFISKGNSVIRGPPTITRIRDVHKPY